MTATSVFAQQTLGELAFDIPRKNGPEDNAAQQPNDATGMHEKFAGPHAPPNGRVQKLDRLPHALTPPDAATQHQPPEKPIFDKLDVLEVRRVSTVLHEQRELKLDKTAT